MKVLNLVILTLFCFSTFAQNVLVNNDDHYIEYNISGGILEINIEDKRDNESNIYYFNRPGEPTNGNDFGKCGTQTGAKSSLINEYSRWFDNTLIEFDLNGNGILEGKVDFGVHAGYKFRVKNDKAFPHELNNEYRLPLEREVDRFGAIVKKRSQCKSAIDWKATKLLATEHLVYSYKIPLEEVLLKNNHVINFRVLVLRTARICKGDRPYGTFIYPQQDCEYSEANQFFSIDLLGLKNNSFAQNISKEINDLKNKQAGFAQKNINYTKEAKSKSLQSLPKSDGLYLKMKNGQFIKLDRYPATIGAKMDYKYRNLSAFNETRRKNKAPYFLEEDFLNTQIFQLKNADLDAYYMVASGALKDVVDQQSFHPVELLKLESGELRIVREDTGASITNQTVYSFKNRIPSVNTIPAESWSYKTTSEFSFKPGVYAVWAQDFVWLFEIIP